MVNAPRTSYLTATLGTDHHRFDRLVRWLDGWIAEQSDVEAFVQHGHSSPPRHGEGVAMVARDDLLDHLARAFVAVTHGGTGSIMDARSLGLIPVVVPRAAALNEHVDDHQVRFARKLAAMGWVHLAENETALREHLDLALHNNSAYRRPSAETAVLPAGQAIDELLASVLSKPAGVVRVRRFRPLLRYLARATGGRRATETGAVAP